MPTRKRAKLNIIPCQQGAAAVEFAIVVSLLFLIVFGILEFALIFMQGHYVENAAREGIRAGVRANNYTTSGAGGCPNIRDRECVIEQVVKDYLDTLYNAPVITVGRFLDTEGKAVLSVTVSVANILPPLVSGFIPGYVTPENFSFEATGFYEDPEEYDKDL